MHRHLVLVFLATLQPYAFALVPSLAPGTLQQIDALYPMLEESQRVAASRKDGYWPYISKKQEPPQEYTYGEFPLPLFGELIDKASSYANVCSGGTRMDAEFLDLGSGAGRLVLAAAAMSNPWKTCRGVEYLPSLHSLALEKLTEAKAMNFLTSEVILEECSWDAPELNLSQVDVAFACKPPLPPY